MRRASAVSTSSNCVHVRYERPKMSKISLFAIGAPRLTARRNSAQHRLLCCGGSPGTPPSSRVRVRVPLRVRRAQEHDLSDIKTILVKSGSNWTDAALKVRSSKGHGINRQDNRTGVAIGDFF
jgi:hypothetical protein